MFCVLPLKSGFTLTVIVKPKRNRYTDTGDDEHESR